MIDLKFSCNIPWRRLLLSSLFIACYSASVFGQSWQQPPRSQANLDALARVEVKSYRFEQAGGIKMEYSLYVPTSYDGSADTPLVMALHGLGSGISYMMEYNNLVELAEEFGYLVAAPMGFNERGWYGARGQGNEFNRARNERDGTFDPSNLGELSELDVLNVLAKVRTDYNIDSDRIYLIGQSMGGGGTWYLGSKYSEIWAALAPMAPAIRLSPDILDSATHLPVMVVMGDADELVDVKVTRQWVARLHELGMTHEYIEVPGGSHSSAGRENIGKVFEFLSKHKK